MRAKIPIRDFLNLGLYVTFIAVGIAGMVAIYSMEPIPVTMVLLSAALVLAGVTPPVIFGRRSRESGYVDLKWFFFTFCIALPPILVHNYLVLSWNSIAFLFSGVCGAMIVVGLALLIKHEDIEELFKGQKVLRSPMQ
ncbi:MAG: hypothetical protein SVY15_09320 [Halobacteriota archaeon]|nr:hypothetical protein [Halobacteriota archaeon]